MIFRPHLLGGSARFCAALGRVPIVRQCVVVVVVWRGSVVAADRRGGGPELSAVSGCDEPWVAARRRSLLQGSGRRGRRPR